MGTALALVQLFNAAAPGIAELVLLIRRKDGTISIAAVLDEADQQFQTNIKQAAEWIAAHRKGE
jgi:hypothetical protein